MGSRQRGFHVGIVARDGALAVHHAACFYVFDPTEFGSSHSVCVTSVDRRVPHARGFAFCFLCPASLPLNRVLFFIQTVF